MAEHHFELTSKETLDNAVLDALVTTGCNDATVSSWGDLIFAEFGREAPTMLAAVISAIDQVESVDGLEVLHVKGQRGPGAFPTAHATRNPLWRWSEVDAWFAAYECREPATERLLVLAAINGALQARQSLRNSQTPSCSVTPSSTSWRRSWRPAEGGRTVQGMLDGY